MLLMRASFNDGDIFTNQIKNQSCVLLKTGDDHRWLHMITDALYMVKFKVSINFCYMEHLCGL